MDLVQFAQTAGSVYATPNEHRKLRKQHEITKALAKRRPQEDQEHRLMMIQAGRILPDALDRMEMQMQAQNDALNLILSCR